MNRMPGKNRYLQSPPKKVPERIGVSLLVGFGFVLKVRTESALQSVLFLVAEPSVGLLGQKIIRKRDQSRFSVLIRAVSRDGCAAPAPGSTVACYDVRLHRRNESTFRVHSVARRKLCDKRFTHDCAERFLRSD